jgi:hypothetical protein
LHWLLCASRRNLRISSAVKVGLFPVRERPGALIFGTFFA